MATVEKDITQESETQSFARTEAQAAALILPKPYIWTREKYEEAIESGLFGSEDRLELLEGVIVEKMPQNPRHQSAIGAMQEVLARLFSSGFWVRIQMPLAVSTLSNPEPDFAVVTSSWRDYTEGSPTGERAVLVVEISDTTLATDQGVKAALYARAMIPEYWIVNVAERVLEVYREPGPAANAPLGFAYGEVTRLAETETVTPLAIGGSAITVSDLMP